MPSHTRSTAPFSPSGTWSGSLTSLERTDAVTSATRKLSSLCSRTRPTSVLPKTSIWMSQGLGIGDARRRSSMFALSYLEPQELVAQTDQITRDQPMRAAQLEERAVRASQVLQ